MMRTIRLGVAILGIGPLFFRRNTCEAGELLPIPNRLVVLTFDDGNKSDVDFAAPLLKR